MDAYGTETLFFGMSRTTAALAAMGGCYFFLFTEKANRAVAALLTGAALVFLGVISQEAAVAAIDFNTLALLTGMMIIVSIAEKSGMFQYAAIWGTKKVRAHPAGILAVTGIITALFSAFLDNVTTVLLIVPVIMQIAKKLEVEVYPYLLMAVFSSNIGGTATLIGDPPNILIGSALGLSFTDFLVNLAPAAAVIQALLIAAFALFWRGKLETTLQNRARVMQIDAKAAITDAPLLKRALAVLAAVVVAFMAAHHIGLENGFIALLGAAVMLLLYTRGTDKEEADARVAAALKGVDWTTVFFFTGLFVVVGALEQSGFLRRLGLYFVNLSGGDIAGSTYIVLGVSALLSAVVDNIPFVATMIPVLAAMEEEMGGREAMMPVWWALSLGACLGGNGTLIGASANVIVAGMAARAGKPMDFLKFLWWSLPVMLLSVLVAGGWLLFLL